MSLRVLIIDDSAAVQSALGSLLTAHPGIEIAGRASDRASGLALIESTSPDLVVLDVDLAHRDRGYDVLVIIRERWPDLPVIMLSNYGWSAMRHAFIDAGAQAYFDKALEFGRAVQWIRTRAGRPGDGDALGTRPVRA
jgi:DNA-binding NarL/FixJ family response regulator